MRYTYDKDNYNRMDVNGSGDEVTDAYYTRVTSDYVKHYVSTRARKSGSFDNRPTTHPHLVAMNLAEYNAFYGIGAHMRKLLLDVICPVLIEEDGQTELTEFTR